MRSEPNPSAIAESSSSPMMGLPIGSDCGVEDCEQEILRILDSPYFSGSKRLSEFVSFSARAAIGGRTEIDQYEVASEVLNRPDDFNPLDDASVRKLASQVRAKLEEYFQEQGAADPIMVSLPRRSYVLRFRVNEAAEHAAGTGSADQTEGGVEDAGASPAAHDSMPVDGNVVASGITPPNLAGLPDITHPAGSGAPAGTSHSRMIQGGRPLQWRGLWTIGVVVIAMLAGAAIYQGLLGLRARPQPTAAANAGAESEEFRILSKAGDLRGKGGEFLPGAVLLGPSMGLDGDATVRMQFLPETAGQHGGLMIAQDADNYVRFGSHFKVRSMLEFGHERNGNYSMPESTYQFDPLAQSGLPLWLSIRKQAEKYTAFSSRDGQHWEPFGSEQFPQSPLTNSIASLYAFNGRTSSPEVEARFRHLGVGLRFHHRPEGPVNAADFPGWRLHSSCKEPNLIAVRNQALELQFSGDELCGSGIERRWEAPAGEPWYVEAYLDFQAVNGSSAAVVVSAEKGSVRLARRDLSGGSIMLERNIDRDVYRPDFPGSPPIYLRLAARDGYMTGSFSRDGEHYEQIASRIPLDELGPVRGFGLEAELSHWVQVGRRPPVRLISIEHGLLTTKPMSPPTEWRDEAAGVPISAK